jgi:nitroreductase
MDCLDAIKVRRSCRSFENKPVPEDVLNDMLLAAQLAPSGGNGQNHLFGVIDDKELKIELAKAAGNQMWIAEAPVVIACCAALEDDLKELPQDDFGLIVNELRFTKNFIKYLNQFEDRKAVGTLFANAAPLIPAEHMVLAAAAQGLSACFIGWLDVKEASRILSLPDDVVCLFLLPVGYPKAKPKAKKLKSMEEISFRNRYAR